jgi:hypothetical protein
VPSDAQRAQAKAASISAVPPARPDADQQAVLDGERELRQALELARAREARLQADNRTLVEALERAERQLGELATLREEAEIGRRQRDAAFRLQVLESSSSWRLTRPLRLVSVELRRLLERIRQR